MATPLPTPIPRGDFTHVQMQNLEFRLLGGALDGLLSTVHYGTMDPAFIQRFTVQVDLTGAQALAALSPEEIAALLSIREKVIAFATTQVPT